MGGCRGDSKKCAICRVRGCFSKLLDCSIFPNFLNPRFFQTSWSPDFSKFLLCSFFPKVTLTVTLTPEGNPKLHS
eukprot:UN12914